MLTRDEIRGRVLGEGGLIDAHTHVGIDPASFYDVSFPYGTCADDMIVRMDVTGVDFAVCFPLGYTAYFSLAAYRRGEFRHDPEGGCAVPYQLENERLCEEIYEAFPEYAGRLLPFAMFDPSREAAGQADFVEALARRYPILGLKTVTSYNQAFVRDLLAEGSCLLDMAARQDLPVTIHSAVMPGDPWANVFDILRVARERPDVRFAIAHTCRFDVRALEEAAALENCWVDLSAFHIHCLLAQQDHPAVAEKAYRFPADYRDHAGAMQKIAGTYPDTVVWGTDTPAHYWMSKFIDEEGEVVRMRLPCGPYVETGELRKLPEALQRRIGYENTVMWLFGKE